MNTTIAVTNSKLEDRAMEMAGLTSFLIVLSLIIYVMKTVIAQL